MSIFDFDDPKPPTRRELATFWTILVAGCVILVAGTIDLVWRLADMLWGAA